MKKILDEIRNAKKEFRFVNQVRSKVQISWAESFSKSFLRTRPDVGVRRSADSRFFLASTASCSDRHFITNRNKKIIHHSQLNEWNETKNVQALEIF